MIDRNSKKGKVANTDILFVGNPWGILPKRADTTLASDLSQTRALYDFDTMIVDMNRVLNEQELVPSVALLTQKQFEAEHLLAKGGIIICLVRPAIVRDFFGIRGDSYGWLPVPFFSDVVRNGVGKRITRVRESHFDEYLDLPGIAWKAFLDKSDTIRYEMLARNDAGFAVAARLKHRKGSIYFLPLSTHKDSLSVVLKCLEKAWSVELERPQPDWLKTIRVPEEEPISKQLKELEVKNREIVRAAEELSKHLAQKLEIKKLLYEQGSSLEETVRLAFQELGRILEKKGDMDLVSNGPSNTVILEVTGSDGTIGLGKLRQLLDFMDKEKGSNPKGVLVGNHEIDVPPDIRGVAFTQHVIDRASFTGVCLLPTTELFQALVAVRQKKLDPKKFWSDLLNAVGIFQLKL